MKTAEELQKELKYAAKIIHAVTTDVFLHDRPKAILNSLLKRLDFEPRCLMCSDTRMIGGPTLEGGETHPCPECCLPSGTSCNHPHVSGTVCTECGEFVPESLTDNK